MSWPVRIPVLVSLFILPLAQAAGEALGAPVPFTGRYALQGRSMLAGLESWACDSGRQLVALDDESDAQLAAIGERSYSIYLTHMYVAPRLLYLPALWGGATTFPVAVIIYLFAIGVQNLFNVFPDRNSTINSFNGIQTFPSHSPFGMNGRGLYARIGRTFDSSEPRRCVHLRKRI